MMTPPPAPRHRAQHDDDEAEAACGAPTPLLDPMDADVDLGGLTLLLEATEQTSPFKEEVVGGSGGSSSPEQGPRIPVSRVALALEAAARVAAAAGDNSAPPSSSSRRSVGGSGVVGRGGRGRKSTEKALAAAAAAEEAWPNRRRVQVMEGTLIGNTEPLGYFYAQIHIGTPGREFTSNAA